MIVEILRSAQNDTGLDFSHFLLNFLKYHLSEHIEMKYSQENLIVIARAFLSFARHLRRTAVVAVQVSNLLVRGDCFVGKNILLAMT